MSASWMAAAASLIQSGRRLARQLLGHVGLALRLHGSGRAAGHLGCERRGVVRA